MTRPIIFSGPMVRAILEGRKTQTRRIVKPQPFGKFLGLLERPLDEGEDPVLRAWFGAGKDELTSSEITCPHGKPGDLLWVREKWQDYCPMWDGAWCGHGTQEGIARDHQPVYAADDQAKHLRGPDGEQRLPLKWKPSIHMPHWASRITLEIVAVRVERLQEISEEDAKAEGVEFSPSNITLQSPFGSGVYRNGFQALWSTIHAADGLNGWAANPWCWVIEFRRAA